MENLSGVYQIVNSKNGHRYIGSTNDLKRRQEDHLSDLSLGRHHSRHLQNAYNLYGKDIFIFESLLCNMTKEDRLLVEQHLLDRLQPEYNISPLAQSTEGMKYTDEAKLKISVALSGRKLSEKHRQNLSKANKGYKHTEETKQKMSIAKKIYYQRIKSKLG